MIFGLGTNRRLLVCPFCLKEHRAKRDERSCPACHAGYPPAYLDTPAAMPLVVPLIGWSQVGKTHFLRAITMALDSMVRLWPNFRPPEAASADTQLFKQSIRNWGRSGNKVDATQLPSNPVYILVLDQMVRWGSRTLVIRDWAGEWFHDWSLREPTADNERPTFDTIGSLLEKTQTAFLMYPLPEVWDVSSDRTIDELALMYINTARLRKVDVRKQSRKFIVVLSKADDAINRFPGKVPENIANYLASDPVRASTQRSGSVSPWTDATAQDYVERMFRVSDAIQEWLDAESDVGARLLRTCRSYGIDVHFTITSSLPRGTSADGLAQEVIPARVLDPLFWAFEINTA